MVVADNVSTPSKKNERREVMGRFIGVDLHKNMFVACFLGFSNKSHQLRQYHITAIDNFRKELRSTDMVGVESTGNTRYFLAKIVDRVKEVKVINPLQFKVISQSVKKTDSNDALTIARFLSKGMLPEISST